MKYPKDFEAVLLKISYKLSGFKEDFNYRTGFRLKDKWHLSGGQPVKECKVKSWAYIEDEKLKWHKHEETETSS
jgi:hypothetical protein